MKKLTVSLLAILLFSCFVMATPVDASSPTTVHYGHNNGDVWDLQYRLHTIGLYTGEIDGNFGPHTAEAVQKFQQKYGLTVDRVVGPQTWHALKRYSVNRDEMMLLARAVYSEARGEPYVGQVAVAAVIMNRVRSADFPDSVAGVIFQPRAFTAVDDGQFWLEPNATAYAAAYDALRGWDPTNGALYYFNPDTATSAWIWTRPQGDKIGRHIFAY